MLPHITNSQAGINKYESVWKSLFECYLVLPEALRAQFGKDEMLITEHILSVSGIGATHRTAQTSTQKFMGTTRTYINPKLDSTSAEIEIKLSLNLRNAVDNYIYKLFKAWAKLGYDIATGEGQLKKDYCADWMKISIANRVGDIYHEIVFKDVMMADSLQAVEDLDYTSNDIQELTVKFVSDWWTDTMV